MVKIKTNKKIIVSIFIVTVIYIILGFFGNKVFATTPGTLTSNINEVDETKYPGYKTLINGMKAKHPNYIFLVYYTGMDWNEVITAEYQSHGISPLNLFQVSSNYNGMWQCPICGNKIAIRSSFCNKCSWGISPLEGIEEVSYLNVYDSEHLRFAKERYLQQVSSEAKIKELTEMVESKKSADQSNIEYQKILKKQDDEIQTYKRSLTQANDMVRQLRGLLEDQKRMFANEIETYINAISNKDAELTALQNKYRDYRNSLDVDRFKGTFDRTTPQKISEKIITSIISECSAYPGVTFSPGDALRRIGFNSKLCEQLLESRYNVHLSQKSLSTCLTVSDLHAMIRKACEVGSI